MTCGGNSMVDVLYGIRCVIDRTEDPHAALELTLGMIAASLGVSGALVSLINPDTNLLEVEVSKGLTPDLPGLNLAGSQYITGRVAMSGQPLLVTDSPGNSSYTWVDKGMCSEMAAPMLVEGMVVGVIYMGGGLSGVFTDEDLDKLVVLTNEATNMVNRLWLYRQHQAKAKQLEAIITIGRELVTTRELQSVLDSITDEARNLMGCRVCAIFLLNSDGESLRLSSLSGVKGLSDYRENLRVEDSSVGVAINRKKQVAVWDLAKTEEHHFIDLTQSEGLVSLLATPILFEDEAIGVLNAYTDTPHRFNNDEKRVFSTLASLGAVAIENSRLYSRVFSSEDSLRKNERLTTLGLLAAEIAHEVRNPLTTIKLLFDSLNLDYQADDPRREDAAIIHEKLHQLEEIVDRVLGFGKSRTEMHAHFSLTRLVEETLLLVRLKLEQSKVRLIYEPPGQSLMVDVHKGQIQQVLLNLVLNALKAMPDGGEMHLSLARVETHGTARIEVTLTDTGLGIPSEVQEHLFDSFLTGAKGGSGLGLSISKQILKSHHGQIRLISSGPGGTVFQFWLPEVSA